MNRRESLKALGVTGISAGVLVAACNDKPETKEASASAVSASTDENADRLPNEVAREKGLEEQKFFTADEMATITILADIIIPKDEKSGSASDAKVPEFIEFIVKDMPDNQVPMRGGLRWMDNTCLKRHEKAFKDCSKEQQLKLVDEIAYPSLAKPDMQQGVAFLNRMRSLTASGFFSSKMGMDDVGYVGNRPNKWEGVPADIIKQYGLEDVKFG